MSNLIRFAGVALAMLPVLGWSSGTIRASEANTPQQIAQAPPAPVREITRIAGEVYRFRNNFHYSVFAVTPEGVIATDPIDADAARWLKGQIKQRFNKPIRYVIYSHDHPDHISGGEVFAADGAIVISHERAKPIIIGEKRPTAIPQVTFNDRMTIELGGEVVELSYVGRNHSNNMIVMRFPKERILFAVDFIPVHSVAFREFPDAYLEEWIESLKRVELMDFDILAPGHGPLGKKSDVAEYRGYMEDLYIAVLAGMRAGKPLAELQQTITLDKYKDWNGYKEMRAENIAGMYRLIKANRFDE